MRMHRSRLSPERVRYCGPTPAGAAAGLLPAAAGRGDAPDAPGAADDERAGGELRPRAELLPANLLLPASFPVVRRELRGRLVRHHGRPPRAVRPAAI